VEQTTRQHIMDGLVQPGKEARPGDILIASDVDEWPKAKTVLFLRHCTGYRNGLLLNPVWTKFSFEFGVHGYWGAGPHAMVIGSEFTDGSVHGGNFLAEYRLLSNDENFMQRLEQSAFHCSWCFANVKEMINKVTSWAHQVTQQCFRASARVSDEEFSCPCLEVQMCWTRSDWTSISINVPS
jgi:Glycosyltransferase family 17